MKDDAGGRDCQRQGGGRLSVLREVIVAIAYLRAGGHEPVRVYLRQGDIIKLKEECARNLVADAEGTQRRIFALPLSQTFGSEPPRVLAKNGVVQVLPF